MISDNKLVNLFKTTYNNKTVYTYFNSGLLIELPSLYLSYLIDLTEYSYSHKTIKTYAEALLHPLNWIANTKTDLSIDEELKNLSREDLQNWSKTRGASRYKETVFRKFINFLESKDGLHTRKSEETPYRSGKYITKPIKKNDNMSPKYLEEEQIIKLLNGFLNESERVMWHFCFDVGLRSSELINIKKKDIPNPSLFPENTKYYRIDIAGAKGSAGGINPRGSIVSKIVLDRVIKYHESYEYKFCSDYSENDPDKPAFLSVHGKHLTDSIIKQMKRAAKRIGLNQKDYHPHSLRHAFAYSILRSNLTTNNQDALLLLKDYLGHSNIQSTEIYAPIQVMALNEVNGNGQRIDRYEEAKRIYDATFLPPFKNIEKRGHSRK